MAVVDCMEGGLSGMDSGVFDRIIDIGEDNEDGVDVEEEVKKPTASNGSLTFDQGRLQRYVLLCGQHVDGGLRDKPSKMRDYYHSCYDLSGLSVAQHTMNEDGIPIVEGDKLNKLKPTHPCINIRVDRVEAALEFFKDKENRHSELIKED